MTLPINSLTQAMILIIKYVIIFAGSPPGTPNDITTDPSVQFTRNGATMVIRWTPVITADNYTVEVSPTLDSGSRVITTTNTTLTIPYNTNYTVAVFASNCIGDSSTTTTTVRIGTAVISFTLFITCYVGVIIEASVLFLCSWL